MGEYIEDSDLSYQEVLNQIQEYETNYLTPEMDSKNFESPLSLIYDDLYLTYDNQVIRDWSHGIPIAYLSSYYGRTYGKLTRPFSSKAIIENIVPFFVVNKWFKVFYLKEKENTDTQSDYIIVDRKVKKSEVETRLRKQHSYLPTGEYEIIRLEEITV